MLISECIDNGSRASPFTVSLLGHCPKTLHSYTLTRLSKDNGRATYHHCLKRYLKMIEKKNN